MNIDLDFINQSINLNDNNRIESDFLKYCNTLDIPVKYLKNYFQHKINQRIFKLLGLYKRGSCAMFIIQYQNKHETDIISISQLLKAKYLGENIDI